MVTTTQQPPLWPGKVMTPAEKRLWRAKQLRLLQDRLGNSTSIRRL